MAIFYSSSTRGFYDSEIHGAHVPADAVQISPLLHSALLLGEASGMVITLGDDGTPVLVHRPEEDPAEVLSAWRASAAVSRFQARAALHAAGLLSDVEAAVAGADAIVQIAWADATQFRRASPTIATLSAAIGLTDEQVDELFRQAAQISA